MKDTLKFFWPVLAMQFVIQEVILLYCNKLTNVWLQIAVVTCMISVVLFINKFKDQIEVKKKI